MTEQSKNECPEKCFIGAEIINALDDMIAKDAAILDRGEFPDGTGRRDPYERGVTQGMKMARLVALRALDAWE